MPIASASAGTSTVADKAASSSAAAAFATTQLSKSVAKVSSKETDVAEADDEKAKPKGPLLRRVWSVIKHEAQHYWHGTKLLGKEMSISARLVRRVMLGYSLTRRERRQLKRTTADILRLIPFVPFVIIPFAELLLPVAIKVFPNMLPSTFESKFAEEEKRRGLIKVRLEMAKFLQETIKDGGLQASERLQSKDEFKEFFRKVRSTGESPSSEDVLKVARLFDDDLTLDNLSRPQLVSICRYMQVNAFGTDNYLRYQIRNRLSRLRQDDMVIASEGLDNMSHHELQKACQDRGIVTANLTDARLGSELSQWIDLHLHQRISGTLLILSKAFNFVAQGSADAAGATPQLRALELTLSSLPANLLNEAELNVHSDSATNKQRLEVLQEQEELIEDEAEQEQEEKEAREKDRERKRAAAAAEKKARAQREEEEEEAARALLPPGELHTRSIAAGSASGTGTGEGAAAATSPASSVSTAGYTDKLASSNGSSMKPAAASEEEEVDARMTHEQLSELGEALALLSAKSSVLREREELNELMKEVSEVEQLEADASLADAAALASDSVNTKRGDASKEAAAFFPASGDGQGASEAEKAVEAESEKAKQSAARALSQQSSATRSLVKRVTKMLQKIDEQLEAYDRDVGSRMHIIKASPTGKISVDDLESALRLIKHRPDEEVLEKIVDKLDVDNDGLVPLEDVLELAKEESGLGILRDESIQDIREQGQALKNEEPDRAIRKSDIVDG
ncbi:LETM1-domain-containing protein [Tilletiaria anomala UBC 951]|uniref:Mitochondrial proton/calcium exchanger protein n=1 Tax=Tilletiaria anomala (strain ATCC 24038 / CBS 436.72 / UBC 951) TaxID=1037660 RepID=A0A066WLV6_TILAU|nr:LETM1-domain-containing protein [Tilletiaria anomala UBC 951]KDN53578.1 LETM1-domain-containing protein [Tilletiaria anomala UBC 951]